MDFEIKTAIHILKNGGIILYPSDTVWGIGCDATNPDAISKIYKLKQRIESKAMICLVSDFNMLKTYVKDIPKTTESILKKVKNPTTIIYSKPQLIAKNLIANDDTIAIRVVQHGFTHHLIKILNKPIVSTSANISSHSTPESFKKIHEEILKGVDYVVNLPNEKSNTKPSTIIKLSNDGIIKVIRE